jgi:hypothetical protein
LSARPKVWVSKSWRDYVAGFSKIDRGGLEGIEWLTARFLYALWVPTLAFWLRIFLSKYFREALIVEVYVAASVAVTFVAWLLMANCWWAILCSWFLFSTVVVLLHVVLLSKIFGDVQSVERSLILFICNVVQLVFTFSIWYELTHLPKGKALFSAILVFATLGYPKEAPTLLVGIQIATDFLLLAIFLAHIVGRVGYQRRDTEAEITRRTLVREIRKLKE